MADYESLGTKANAEDHGMMYVLDQAVNAFALFLYLSPQWIAQCPSALVKEDLSSIN